jgi:diacylglycerol kinase family enzyme
MALRRVAVVFNPMSGSAGIGGPGRRRDEIRAALAVRGAQVKWYETSSVDPGQDATRHAVSMGVDVVLASGGDGTVMACASSLLGTAVPLAIVPCGTGNIIASSLGVPVGVAGAVDAALHGHRRSIDVGTSNTAVLFAAGIGLTAAMMRDTTPPLKARFGLLAYVFSASRHLLGPRRKYRISLDHGPPIVRTSHGVIVGNFGEMVVRSRGLKTALDDGRFEIGVLRLRPGLNRAHRTGSRPPSQLRPPLDWYQASHVTVTCDHPQPTERDGDWIGFSSSLQIEVLSRALDICVPDTPDTPGRIPTLSSLVADDLMRLLPRCRDRDDCGSQSRWRRSTSGRRSPAPPAGSPGP